MDEMREPVYNCDLAFFSFFFPPETGAAAIRLGEFAAGLSRLGRKLKVLAPLPNYPSGEIHPDFKAGKCHRDWWQGMDVLRVPLIPPKGKGGARRMLTYLSYNLSAECSRRFLLKAKPRAVFASSPPVPAILPALNMARGTGVPFIFDVRDLWPEIAVALGLMRDGSFIHWYLSRIVRRAYRTAAAVIVTSPGDAAAVAQCAVDEKRIHVIPNGANCDIFRPDMKARDEIRSQLNAGDDLLVVYSGSFGRGMNDLDTLLETAFLLREAEGIRFMLIGEGDKRGELEERARRKHLSNIIYVPSQSPEELNRYLNAADAGFIPRREIACDTGGNVPVKMFEYMAVGLPVLLTSIPGCEAQLIQQRANGAGAWFPAGEGKEAARWLYDAKERIDALKEEAKPAREFVMVNYNRADGVRMLNDILSRVVEETGAARAPE
jgi:colanic acid biosynthesis glycosyl transferase WcaI